LASILDEIQQHLTSGLMSAAASQLGEAQSGILKAASALAPTILGGIIERGGDAAARNGIFTALSASGNIRFLDDLGSLISEGNLAQGDPRDMSGNLIGSLFGSKVRDILGAVSSFAGLKMDSTSALLGIVGPLVMGVLSKKIRDSRLDASGLMSLLSSERAAIMGAMPDSIARAAGLPATSRKPAREERSSWGLPLAILAALGLAAFFLTRSCAGGPQNEVAASDTAPNSEYVTNVGGSELRGNIGGVEQQLIDFIESGRTPCTDAECWFTFDRLNFATGSAALNVSGSQEQLTNVQRILTAYPNVQLKIGGYTDNTGSDALNQALSQRRAEAVVGAIVARGIDASRMVAEGYGSSNPVATNATAEGRAQNRRIDVRVRAR